MFSLNTRLDISFNVSFEEKHSYFLSGKPNQGPVFQSIVRLTGSLMTNSSTVVAKLFSNALIFLLLKCESLFQCKSYSHFFSKNINRFVIFQDRNLNVTLANNFIKF